MMRVIRLACLLPFVGFLPMNLKGATMITLINENFSSGTGSIGPTTTWSNNGLNWVWSLVSGSIAPTGTEVYPASGSTVRGMQGTHGGFEVFSIGSSQPPSGTVWQVAVRVVLPTNYPATWNGNTISFDMGYRTTRNTSSFELYNITDRRSIVSQSITGSVGTSSSPAPWTNVTINPTFLSSDAGDTVELRWRDTSSGSDALGLEVGAVRFDVVPEPSVGSLLLVGMAVALRRKRRRPGG